MNEEELLALLAMIEGGDQVDPMAGLFGAPDIYAPQGLPFIPQKTNTRGQPDMNASFNAMQDWVQMQTDPAFMALLSATQGVPLVDYNQQAPQVAPVHTPTLDSLASSTDPIFQNVYEAVSSGRTPFEVEAAMREAGTYDDDQIDLAVRTATQAFEEQGFAQRAQMENAAQLSPLEQAYADAGLPSPFARYGDPGYETDELPSEVRRQDQEVIGRYDDQLAALERMINNGGRQAAANFQPVTRTFSGSDDRSTRPGVTADEVVATLPAERVRETQAGRAPVGALPPPDIASAPIVEPGRRSDEVIRAAIEVAARGGRPTEQWPGEALDSRNPDEIAEPFGTPLDFDAPMTRGPVAPRSPLVDSGLATLSRWAGGGADEERMAAAFGQPIDFTTPRDRGPVRRPSASWRRGDSGASMVSSGRDQRTPARPRSQSAQRYASAVRGNDRYKAPARKEVVQRNRDNLDRRYNERLQRSRQILANGMAAQGRTPLSDAANARQALMRQIFGI